MNSQPYRLLSFGKQTGIGVGDSYHATVHAVAKTNVPNSPYCIPNELVCSAIGSFLCLPLPPAAIVKGSGSQAGSSWFASLDFNLAGNTLPPVDVRACVKQLPELSTGLVVFDCLVANCDRHRGNFAVDFGQSLPRMSIFDHSHALFGYEAGKGINRLTELRDRLAMSGGSVTGANRHCLLDHIDTCNHFRHWTSRVEKLPDFQIEEACNQSVGFGVTQQEADFAIEFLKHRRTNIRAIINANKSEFVSVASWGLFV